MFWVQAAGRLVQECRLGSGPKPKTLKPKPQGVQGYTAWAAWAQCTCRLLPGPSSDYTSTPGGHVQIIPRHGLLHWVLGLPCSVFRTVADLACHEEP